MGLKLLWQNSPAEIEGKHIQQIIAFAGQGKLQDENSTSQELREYLKQVPSDVLSRYANECLTSKFDSAGFALQDIVNQIGQRLGFQVEYGRYRGTKSDTGHDGLWRFPDGHSVVVEVKTTDTFGIVSTIADYRKKLIVSKAIDEDRSSIQAKQHFLLVWISSLPKRFPRNRSRKFSGARMWIEKPGFSDPFCGFEEMA